MRYVALLRGVNLGGTNKVAMPELRDLVESIGLSDVSTYIQSGNVLFTAGKPPDPTDLESAIEDRFGISVSVALRSASDLRKALRNNPFPDAETSTLHVGFLTDKPRQSVVAQLDAGRFAPDEFAVRGTEMYLHLPNGMGRSKLPPYLGRKLGVPTTIRNWNTVSKLAELLG